MNEAVGTKTVYFITQVNTDNNEEHFIEYNTYVGSFMTTSSHEMATRFDAKELAIDLAKLQNQTSKLLKRPFSYRVIEEIITRTEVYTEIEKTEVPSEDETVE